MPTEPPHFEPNSERFRDLMVADEPDFEELLVCVFGITEPIANAYRLLLAQPDRTTSPENSLTVCTMGGYASVPGEE